MMCISVRFAFTAAKSVIIFRNCSVISCLSYLTPDLTEMKLRIADRNLFLLMVALHLTGVAICDAEEEPRAACGK